ncbi:hypothetical protein [Alienimonas chondri]|uniref:Uncharacterized protein n=1 Tax=Alienimonas chondri TaxID=2681879 RepID=A0ABX1VCG3_9PLAN|nr:hypothetical protein [Alienimonas chondri]NNJ25794.1 hypothetical protein [Alienimonas chondri]
MTLLTGPWLWLRFPLAVAAAGLAWWAFGRRPAPGEPDRRKPWAVWSAGFAAAWLVLAGEGFVFLFSRNAKWWLPVVAVGITGSWFLLRGTRGTRRGRRWAAGAVVLMIAAPFLSRAEAIVRTNRDVAEWILDPLGAISWWYWPLIGEGLGGVAVLLTAALIAAAVWRPTEPQECELDSLLNEIAPLAEEPPA